jgi:hypothetical protein
MGGYTGKYAFVRRLERFLAQVFSSFILAGIPDFTSRGSSPIQLVSQSGESVQMVCIERALAILSSSRQNFWTRIGSLILVSLILLGMSLL